IRKLLQPFDTAFDRSFLVRVVTDQAFSLTRSFVDRLRLVDSAHPINRPPVFAHESLKRFYGGFVAAVAHNHIQRLLLVQLRPWVNSKRDSFQEHGLCGLLWELLLAG